MTNERPSGENASASIAERLARSSPVRQDPTARSTLDIPQTGAAITIADREHGRIG